MSYCVNCGVEINKSEAKCPLCSCPVINPMQPQISEKRPWPKEEDQLDYIAERRFYAIIFTAILAIPTFICIVINILYGNTVAWSLYVVNSTVLIWIFFILPLVLRRVNISSLIFIDSVAVLFYLNELENLINRGRWFFPVVLPVVVIGGLLAFSIVFLIEKKLLRKLYIPAAVFLFGGLYAVAIEIICDRYISGEAVLSWSLFALIPCIFLSLIFIIIEYSAKVKNTLSKRMKL